MSSAPRLVPTTVSTQVLSEFASDVVIGLSQPGQKELPSKYLYDEVGSALFDVICVLPEYGLSRAGMRTLTRHAGDIVDRLPSPVIVAELGSGSGQKTRLLLEALARKQRVNYYPIDISGSALSRCQQELGQIDRVSIVGFERAYLDGLQEVAARRREGEKIFVLFLGSTIGNFDRPAGDQFLREVRAILHEGDALLLSTDLEKPVDMLKLAYDDPAGVTAAFNKNLAGSHQSRTRRRFRSLAVRTHRALRRIRAAHRDAPAFHGMAAHHHSQSRIRLLYARGRNDLDRKLAQIRLERSGRDGRANRISLRGPMDRFRMALRAESFLCLLKHSDPCDRAIASLCYSFALDGKFQKQSSEERSCALRKRRRRSRIARQSLRRGQRSTHRATAHSAAAQIPSE